MADTAVIVRVEEQLKTAFAAAARAADRTASQLLRDFMRDYVRQRATQDDRDAWLASKAESGRAAARAGHVRPHDDVETAFAARRAASARRRAKDPG